MNRKTPKRSTYADKLPFARKNESSDPRIDGLYLSEDDGQTWRLISRKDDYGSVFLRPSGTLDAVTNARIFADHAYIWMFSNKGALWREIAGKSFGQILGIFADPESVKPDPPRRQFYPRPSVSDGCRELRMESGTHARRGIKRIRRVG